MSSRANAVSLGFLLWVGNARADDDARSAAAQQLFDEAFHLLDQDKVAEACERFDRSYKLEPGGGALFNLALCREKEGKLASAWVKFHDVADRAAREGREDRRKTAQAHMDALEPMLARLRIELPPDPDPIDYELKLDGVVLSHEIARAAFPIDAGTHTLDVTKPESAPWHRQLTIANGSLEEISIPKLAPLPTIKTVALPPERKRTAEWPRTLAWISGGAGILGAGIGIGFGVDAIAQKAVVDRECTGNMCSDEGFAAQERGRTNASASTVALVVGGVLVTAGVLGLLLLPRATAKQTTVAFEF